MLFQKLHIEVAVVLKPCLMGLDTQGEALEIEARRAGSMVFSW